MVVTPKRQLHCTRSCTALKSNGKAPTVESVCCVLHRTLKIGAGYFSETETNYQTPRRHIRTMFSS
jgi:hypothetical protein